ncbi:MAG: hypothetical protein IJB73_08250 [Firmicutes bacterium]|nr:hypothetical protein [Bacillota bacterium]
MRFLDYIEDEMKFQKHLRNQFLRLKRVKEEGKLSCIRNKGKYKNYYIALPGENHRQYIKKKDMDRVYRLQLQAIGRAGAASAENNIRLLGALLEEYKDCTIETIADSLSEEYGIECFHERIWTSLNVKRPFPQSESPYRREDLRHTTSFGLLTRSKSEAQIAEQLAAAGAQLEFYYEKALTLITEDGRSRTIYPDFTIILPDGRTIYWEHKGMLDFPEYAQRDLERTLLYFRNGIYQPHNLIVTCDGPGGSYPGVEIAEIIEKILLPHAKSRF